MSPFFLQTSQDGAKQLDSIVLVKEEKPGSSKKIYKCALCGKQETNMDELEGNCGFISLI